MTTTEDTAVLADPVEIKNNNHESSDQEASKVSNNSQFLNSKATEERINALKSEIGMYFITN